MNGKLLLVEDQVYFRKGLRKMIEDQTIGWTVVGEAENGEEALEWIQATQPNLVLTDIRMPGMDGIRLAEHLHRTEAQVEVIILTGYEDFQYAQAAIRYGVVDFLLKPCNEQTLLEVLKKAYERLKGVLRQQEEREADRKLKEEALLRALTLRLPMLSAEERLAREQVIGRQMLLVAVDDYFPKNRQYREKDLGLLQFALYNIISEMMARDDRKGAFVSLEFDRFSLFLEAGTDAEEFGRQCREALLDYIGISLTVIACGTITSAEDPPANYERYLKARSAYGPQWEWDAAPAERMESRARSKELEAQLTGAILLGQVENLERVLSDMVERLRQLPLAEAKMEALALTFAMHATAKRQLDAPEETGGFGERIGNLQALQSVQETGAWIRSAADGFLARYEEWKAGKNDNLIDRTLEYIDKHYREACTLTEVAEHLHISPTYFSKLFKKVTGDNFSAYLTKIRMQKAELLLVNTDMKVFEIAAAVGYDDPNYFTNVFRMVHRMSPSDYRKKKKN
ncbi:response regulator [Paenibacillus sp.]|uniref:response regulator transcription factor n=1 Tax=Paenibacillus sp. TaxID=58172 RepID=UPI0028118084|nr:response regulator [Paenibacillus sp.]